MNLSKRISELVVSLYGDAKAPSIFLQLDELLRYRPGRESALTGETLSHTDSFLITYADQVREAGVPCLQSLTDFCESHLKNLISAVHILPFYPSSSDDGFSIVDYRKVDPALGDWEDVSRLGKHFRLMFDAVVNHVSAGHEWFQRFLAGDPRYRDYFHVIKEDCDLSEVVRPRAFPLLTEFPTDAGQKRVWTTFSEDQIDLNFSNPDVLLKIIEVLLYYVARGANFLRLDAVAFLWKEIGTSCLHLPQTHRIIQLFRAVLDEVAPHVFLITETNVPHDDNISYFGDGANEAQMVYNFALPPLVLHTILTANSRELSRWASSLKLPSRSTTFFNFLASHDGIGVNPVRGILSAAEIQNIVTQCMKHGGLVSYKRNSDGTESPYELNISYFDALSDPAGSEGIDLQVDRFLAAHFILLSIVGVPAIYFHSLFGSRSWFAGPSLTGRNRSINREKLLRAEVEAELTNPGTLRSKALNRLRKLLDVRALHPAFTPYGSQEVLDFGQSVFAVYRNSPDGRERILCLQNVKSETQAVTLSGMSPVIDLLNPDSSIEAGTIHLAPYQGSWFVAAANRQP